MVNFTIDDLFDAYVEQLEILQDLDPTIDNPDLINDKIKKAETIVHVGDSIMKLANTSLKAMRIEYEMGIDVKVPKFLNGANNGNKQM